MRHRRELGQERGGAVAAGEAQATARVCCWRCNVVAQCSAGVGGVVTRAWTVRARQCSKATRRNYEAVEVSAMA